jgi:hypothetical protein
VQNGVYGGTTDYASSIEAAADSIRIAIDEFGKQED